MSDESRSVLVVTFEDSAEPVKVCVCVCVRVCVCVHVCETLLWSFLYVGGSEGTWLITSFPQIQFLPVKEVFEGEVQPLDQLPHCHIVDGTVKVCMCTLCMCVCVHVRMCRGGRRGIHIHL